MFWDGQLSETEEGITESNNLQDKMHFILHGIPGTGTRIASLVPACLSLVFGLAHIERHRKVTLFNKTSKSQVAPGLESSHASQLSSRVLSAHDIR